MGAGRASRVNWRTCAELYLAPATGCHAGMGQVLPSFQMKAELDFDVNCADICFLSNA